MGESLTNTATTQAAQFIHLSDQQLLALAPLTLPSYRQTRYQADNICVSLDAFTPTDQYALRQIYPAMLDLLNLLQGGRLTLQDTTLMLPAFLARNNWSHCIAMIKRVGTGTDDWQSTEHVRKILHDLKGGCLMAVSLAIQLIQLGLASEDDVLHLFFRTRDYLKMMRACLYDLDPKRHAEDQAWKPHSIQLVYDKWHNVVYRINTRTIRVAFDCRFSGPISESCLEFTALDRIVYNLMHNAALNTADDTISCTILPIFDHQTLNIRFVIANRITPEHGQTLQARYGTNLGALFYGGFTTGGTGLGMRICADLVIQAYGLASIEQGVEDSYIGATLTDDTFINWFHWPAAAASQTHVVGGASSATLP